MARRHEEAEEAEGDHRSLTADYDSLFWGFSYQGVPADAVEDPASPRDAHEREDGQDHAVSHETTRLRGLEYTSIGLNDDAEDDISHHSRNVPYHRDELRNSQATTIQDHDEVFRSSPVLPQKLGVELSPIAPGSPLSDHDEKLSRSFECTTRQGIMRSKSASIAVIISGILAFTGSFLYLYAAIRKPDWSSRINDNGALDPTTAALLCTLIAKVIEMLFVTVVVATIGQHLSHRAISLANKRGITIADLTLRNLIIQPGILFTQFRAIRYSAMTMLGLFIFSATLGATFYTTAAEALVSPKLIMGDWHHLNVSTMVHTVFSNLSYIEKHCTVPGYEYFGKTASCVQLGNVGQSYHDYQAWLSNWNQSGPHSEKLSERPPPTGLYLENTTVTGTWLQDPKAWSRYYPEDRLVNSATYAFPHPGVLAAAIDPHNKIRQPSFFGNSSKFSLEATVASPVINVLCAGVSEEELVPLVYANWSGTDFDAGTWQSVVSRPLATELYKEKPGLNKTKVDRLFGWGDSDMEDYRPLFGRFPAPNNTVINVAAKWGFKSTYVLIGVPPELSGAGSSHVLCRARAAMGSGCFTTYHAEASGGKLFTTCDERNRLAYMGPGLQYLDWDPNWVDIAASWTESVSLSTGVMGDPTSNAGVLSHLVSNDTRKPLPRDRPSVAEALAVMAGSTLLSGARNGTISADSWADQIITAPRRHSMTARLQTTILQSGGQVRQWQKALFGSLLIVCLLSLLCCLYLLGELLAQHITDFTEPQNMFALAMNSPPTVRLAGACGVGPDRAQWRQGWKIDLEHRTQHYFIRPSHDVRYSVLEKAAAESGQGLGEALSAGDAETVKGRSSLTDIRPEVTQEFSSLQKRWSILDFFKLSRRKVV